MSSKSSNQYTHDAKSPGTERDLSVCEVAAELGLHPVTVRRLVGQGVIPGYRAGLRAWRVTRQALDNLKAAGGPNALAGGSTSDFKASEEAGP